VQRPVLSKLRMTIDMVETDQSIHRYRFQREQLRVLVVLLKLPDVVQLSNGSIASGEECLLCALQRMASVATWNDSFEPAAGAHCHPISSLRCFWLSMVDLYSQQSNF